jgi:hypothetical protein
MRAQINVPGLLLALAALQISTKYNPAITNHFIFLGRPWARILGNAPNWRIIGSKQIQVEFDKKKYLSTAKVVPVGRANSGT